MKNEAKTAMTYEAFAALYEEFAAQACHYTADQIGRGDFCEKLAELTDAHPDFEARYDNEH